VIGPELVVSWLSGILPHSEVVVKSPYFVGGERGFWGDPPAQAPTTFEVRFALTFRGAFLRGAGAGAGSFTYPKAFCCALVRLLSLGLKSTGEYQPSRFRIDRHPLKARTVMPFSSAVLRALSV
jgi:hypothetical protein